MIESKPVTGAYTGPSAYWRRYFSSSLVATDLAIAVPCASIWPRGLEYSARIGSRLSAYLLVSL